MNTSTMKQNVSQAVHESVRVASMAEEAVLGASGAVSEKTAGKVIYAALAERFEAVPLQLRGAYLIGAADHFRLLIANRKTKSVKRYLTLGREALLRLHDETTGCVHSFLGISYTEGADEERKRSRATLRQLESIRVQASSLGDALEDKVGRRLDRMADSAVAANHLLGALVDQGETLLAIAKARNNALIETITSSPDAPTAPATDDVPHTLQEQLAAKAPMLRVVADAQS